jgi:hypothetical protein
MRRFWLSAVPILLANIALALVTAVCFRLQLNLATVALLYNVRRIVRLLELLERIGAGETGLIHFWPPASPVISRRAHFRQVEAQPLPAVDVGRPAALLPTTQFP